MPSLIHRGEFSLPETVLSRLAQISCREARPEVCMGILDPQHLFVMRSVGNPEIAIIMPDSIEHTARTICQMLFNFNVLCVHVSLLLIRAPVVYFDALRGEDPR